MIEARTTARMIRKLPIWNIAFCAWLTDPAPATSLAVRPKKVRAAGSDDDAFHLALLDDASRVRLVAYLLGCRKRFAGQCRLVDRGEVATDQAQVGGNDDPETYLDDVAQDQGRCVDRGPLAVPLGGSLGCQSFLECGECGGGLPVLPEVKSRVEDE